MEVEEEKEEEEGKIAGVRCEKERKEQKSDDRERKRKPINIGGENSEFSPISRLFDF